MHVVQVVSPVCGSTVGHRTHDSRDGRIEPLDGAYDFQDEDDCERFPVIEAGGQTSQLTLGRSRRSRCKKKLAFVEHCTFVKVLSTTARRTLTATEP